MTETEAVKDEIPTLETPKPEEEEETPEREIVDAEAMKIRERMIPIRLMYLAKNMSTEKPVATGAYWEKAATWIAQLLKLIQESLTFETVGANNLEQNKEAIEKLFEELNKRIDEEEEGIRKEEAETLTSYQLEEIQEFWNKECFSGKQYFQIELFDWMKESYLFIAEKMVDKEADVVEAAFEQVMNMAKEYVDTIF